MRVLWTCVVLQGQCTRTRRQGQGEQILNENLGADWVQGLQLLQRRQVAGDVEGIVPGELRAQGGAEHRLRGSEACVLEGSRPVFLSEHMV